MGSMKIDELTPEQAAILPKFRAEWMAWGTCTDRADRPKAESAIMAMRARIGITAIPTFIWCDSPAGIALATYFLKSPQFREWHNAVPRALRDSLRNGLGDSLRDGLGASLRDGLGASLRDGLRASLWDSLWDSLRASLWDSLGASLGDGLGDSLGDSLRASLWDSLGASLGDGLGASLRDGLRASLWDSLWDSLRASLWDSLGASLGDGLGDSRGNEWWGQHDAYWIALYLFCRDIIGVEYDKKRSSDLDLWRDIAQSCCWWSCYENYVLVSERPTICKLDDRGVMHSEQGPALAFADGWAVHAWHGIRVPAQWIEDKSLLTPGIALKEENVERRRAACEILGWSRVLSELGGETIDRDDDPQIGELLEVDLPGSGRERFLKVRCGTGREFVIPVPADMRTALGANAWTYDVPVDLLKLKEHRT